MVHLIMNHLIHEAFLSELVMIERDLLFDLVLQDAKMNLMMNGFLECLLRIHDPYVNDEYQLLKK